MMFLTVGAVSKRYRPCRALHIWLILVILMALTAQATPALPALRLQAISTNWLALDALRTSRYGHTATLLTNGRVLVVGGVNEAGVVAHVELYDPMTGGWSEPTPMRTPRWGHTATLLPNGNVLVLGGSRSATLTGDDWAIDDGEIYTPDGGWVAIPRMSSGRAGHTATLLRNGKVLVVGGGNVAGAINGAEVYDPSTRQWEATLAGPGARWFHTATLLPNDSVLVAGGRSSRGDAGFLRTATIYVPATNRWEPAPILNTARDRHTATLLSNGKVLVVGGFNGAELGSAELFDIATGGWSVAPTPPLDARREHTATLLPNGRLLIAGGVAGAGYPPTAYLYDPDTGGWSGAGSPPNNGRSRQTATLLPDGRVLLVGGEAGAASNAVDLYDPGVSHWSEAGTMNEPRADHTATLLPDGRVIVVGGQWPLGSALTNTEVYSPEADLWTTLDGQQAAERYGHTATLLPNGKVLVAGGRWSNNALNSAAIFDPATDQWSAAPPLRAPRYAHTATLLPNGKVLVVGGSRISAPVASAEIYDSDQNVWVDAGQLQSARAYHTATLLPNGQVLVVGGGDANGSDVTVAYDTAEIYDWTQNAWTTVTQRMSSVRWNHTATLLPNGQVLVAGGGNSDDSLVFDTAELFTPTDAPANGTWSGAGTLTVRRRDHRATLLPDGRVLLAGSFTSGGSAEFYDPINNAWTSASAPLTGRYGHTLTLLMDGRVLMTGGTGAGATAELFDTGLGYADGWRPQVTSITPIVPPFSNIGVDGTGFFGRSEASSGGTQQSTTGYPLLQIRSLGNEQTLYIGHTPNSTWTDKRLITSNIYIRGKPFPAGYALATVVINGIPSVSRPILFTRQRYVDDNGSDDGNDCLHPKNPCQTIQAAIDRAGSTDQILVAAGYYTETLTVNKRLIVQGAGFHVVSIEGRPDVQRPILNVTQTGGLSLSNVTLQNGSADIGGAVLNEGNLQLSAVVISGNQATDGGGVYNRGRVSIYYSTLSGNTATNSGAAIYNDTGGVLNLFNSTISGNVAANAGGGVANAGSIYSNNATITDNQAAIGGGLAILSGAAAAANTILAANHGPAGSPDCQGTFRSRGYNLVGDTTGCTIISDHETGDIVGGPAGPVDPRLGPLQINAGGTPTHALLIDSPALDAGNPDPLGLRNDACFASDQRGIARPQNGRCDIGAFELERAIRYVATRAGNGDDSNDCQTRALPCEHISAAIDKVPANGIVEIAAGEYPESITIAKNIALAGADAGATTIGGRVAISSASTIATITGVTIANPTPFPGDGGAAFNRGALTLSDSIVRDSEAAGRGGGIYSDGRLTLDDTAVIGNRAGEEGGGIVSFSSLRIDGGAVSGNSADSGGGIVNFGTAILSDTSVLTNSAGLRGGILNAAGATMTLRGSLVGGNTARQNGGITNGGQMTIVNSTIRGNTVISSTAGIGNEPTGTLTVLDSAIIDNQAGTGAGGIDNYSDAGDVGVVRIVGSTISGNRAGQGGGGIGNTGAMWITDSLIDGNRAAQEAGIFNGLAGTLTILNSTVSNNVASGSSGGFFNAGQAWIGNSTISGNSAGEGGGGIQHDGGSSSTLVITSTTIFDNSAGQHGGGIDIASPTPTNPPALQHTILAGNQAGNGPDCFGALSSNGYNLVGDASGCAIVAATGDLIGTVTITGTIDARLAPLAPNGGRTPTHALQPNSLALDHVPPEACLAVDQRGVARPQDGDGDGAPACDIGAFEAQFDVADSGVSFPQDIPQFQNEGGQATFEDYSDVYGPPTLTKVITETATGTITATDQLSMPFSLEVEGIIPTFPPVPQGLAGGNGEIVLPNLNAWMYQATVVTATYADANVNWAGSALKAGMCVGMTSATAKFWAGDDQAPYGGPPVNNMPLTDDMRSLLQKNHMRQISAEVLAYLAGPGRHDDARAYLDYLAARIKDTSGWRQNSEIIGIVNGEGDPEQTCEQAQVGHALWPYRVVRQDAPPLYRIYVYDPNYPATQPGTSDNHYIELSQAGGAWQWSYEIEPGLTWRGSTLYSLRLDTLFSASTLPTEDDSGVLLVNGGQDSAWGGRSGAWGGRSGAWGELPDGSQIGCVLDKEGNLVFTRQISGSLRLFALNTLTNTVLYLPKNEIQAAGSLTFHSRGGEVSDMLVIGKDTVIGYLGTVGDQKTTKDELTVDAALETVSLRTNEVREDKQITIYQMHEGPPGADGVSETHVVAVSNTNLSDDGTLTMTATKDEDGNVIGMRVVNSSGAANTADIGFASVGGNGINTVVFPDFPILPGARYEFKDIEWRSLEVSQVTVEIDRDGDGQVDSITYLPLPPGPSSQVLDRFDRADGVLGPNWAGRTATGEYGIAGRQVRVGAGGVLYWNADTFGADQEAFVTLNRIIVENSRVGLLLKVQGDTPNVRNGAIEVRYYAKNRHARVMVREPHGAWRAIATLPVTLVDGDRFSARATSDGRVQVYRNTTLIGEVRAGGSLAGRGGRIGLRYLDARGAQFDDFGGGTAP